MQQCIFVLGMHRSGTSALMGLLNKLGIDVGPNDMPPNAFNEKGYYENMDTCRLNDDVLDSLHSSWDDPSLLPDKWWKQTNSLSQFSESIINIIKDNYKNSDLFGIKDPRISRLFPLWRETLDELGIQSRAIICFRNPLEVAQSLKKRDGFSINKSLMLWLTYMFEAEFFTKKVKRTFVSFDDLLCETPKVLKRISNILSLDLQDKLQDSDPGLSSFLGKSLKHHNFNGAKLNRDVWDHVVKAYDLLSKFDGEISEETITEFDELRMTYQALNGVFYNIDVKNKVFYHGKLLQEKRTLESVVNSKEDQISELNSIINEKDNQIMSIMSPVKEKEGRIRRLEEGRVRSLEEALREKEATLAHIYNSHGWKALLSYYKIRDKLSPERSMRRRFVKKILNTLRGEKHLIKSDITFRNTENEEEQKTKNGSANEDTNVVIADSLIAIQSDLFDRTRMKLVRDSRKSNARAAVFMPCGSGSIHEQLLTSGDRLWDLVAYCYDDTYVDSIPANMVYRRDGSFNGTKFSAFARLISDNPDFVEAYDYWMLMDNDILTTQDDIGRLFRLMAEYKLDLAQPSLTDDSYCAWPIMKRRKVSGLRHVNAVEIMSFMFSKQALMHGMHLFRQSISGYGIDLAFGVIVRKKLGTKPAVIDDVAIKHTKEIDQLSGKFYSMLHDASISPMDELHHMQRLYKFDIRFFEI